MIASCPSVACPNSRTLARLSIPKDSTLTVGFPTKTGFSGSVPRLRSLRTPPILLRFYGDNTTVTFALADSGVRAQCPIQHSAEVRHAETFTRHCTRKHTDGGAGTDYSGLSAPFSLSPKNAGSDSERQRAKPLRNDEHQRSGSRGRSFCDPARQSEPDSVSQTGPLRSTFTRKSAGVTTEAAPDFSLVRSHLSS